MESHLYSFYIAIHFSLMPKKEYAYIKTKGIKKGAFVRTSNELQRAEKAIKKAGLNYIILNSGIETKKGNVSLSTMHLAKGMEFKAVIVMACDEEVIPSQQRIEKIGDDTDLEEVYNTERNLLYVACTRARDFLFVSGVEPGSEFLEDLEES